MEELRIIKHKDISHDFLLEISKIKSAFGSYGVESQIKWINSNLKDNDIHFLLYDHNELIAYLNLVTITISVDNRFVDCYGIGNVCSNEKGKGNGRKLMIELNNYLVNFNFIGLLFCKINLVEFYSRFDWMLLDRSNLEFSFDNGTIETMIFNCNQKFDVLVYKGNAF